MSSVFSQVQVRFSNHVHFFYFATREIQEQQQQHHRRPSLEDLKAQGIYRTPEQLRAEEQEHKIAGAFLQQELGQRCMCFAVFVVGVPLSIGCDVEGTRIQNGNLKKKNVFCDW